MKSTEEQNWVARYEKLRRTLNMTNAINKLVEEVKSESTPSNVEDLSQAFINWYNSTKKTNGGYAPLAMQIFYWFNKRLLLFDASSLLTQRDDEIKSYKKEIQNWYDKLECSDAQTQSLQSQLEKYKALAEVASSLVQQPRVYQSNLHKELYEKFLILKQQL